MVDHYSESELKLLAILPSITAPLSVLGASMIIFMIVNQKMSSERRLNHRLLLAISATDLITSSVNMLGPLPVRDDVGAYMAMGNVTTCSASGFLIHFFFARALYNMALMWTFLCQIRYELREEDIADKYDRRIHVVAIGYPLITGIVGLVLEVFNPVSNLGLLKCYIAPYPPDCEREDSQVECTRGEMARPYLVVATLIPVIIVVGFLFTSTFLVWWTVRQHAIQARRTSQFNVQSSMFRDVSIQSIMYGIFFFNSYVWVLINPVVDVTIGRESSKLRVIARFLSEIFYPSQGLWTWLIFIRPRYLRIRTNFEEQSLAWVLRETVFGEKLDHAKYSKTPRSVLMRQGSQQNLERQKSWRTLSSSSLKRANGGDGGGGGGADTHVPANFQDTDVGTNAAPGSGTRRSGTVPSSHSFQDSFGSITTPNSIEIHNPSDSVVLERTMPTSSPIVDWDPSVLAKNEQQ
jgi:hypothetical protein